jgi:hypothetical protein
VKLPTITRPCTAVMENFLPRLFVESDPRVC